MGLAAVGAVPGLFNHSEGRMGGLLMTTATFPRPKMFLAVGGIPLVPFLPDT